MVYDISSTTVVSLAKNQNLIQSILSKNPTWVESDVRKAIDQAWTKVKSFAKKNPIEKESYIDYGSVCDKCGGPVKRSGTCWICYAGCGESLGGCS